MSLFIFLSLLKHVSGLTSDALNYEDKAVVVVKVMPTIPTCNLWANMLPTIPTYNLWVNML